MSGRVGIQVNCTVCGNMKKPIGRSAPLSWYGCDHECEGYTQDPKPGSLWPYETEEDFGYPVSDDATERR